MEIDFQIGSMSRENNVSAMSSGSGQIESWQSSSMSKDTDSVAAEIWEVAEKSAGEILFRIQPTVKEDHKRKQVMEYVQGLLRCSHESQVFPYGSVPLKTYLPDGDIDLTTIGSPNLTDALISEVRAILAKEELNPDAPYKVKDVHYIDAEVKLVKCVVQNFVVDISFNQLGGLSTLCFLEKVDRFIGKNHLFKCSIMLIKAWCYYESRILGAHHGLIATYALETLILYIFQIFHHSLNGPLAVLYKFLDHFSKFDWDNYVIGLKGAVCRSSLHCSSDEPLESRSALLFSDEFLKECALMFKVPSRKVDLISPTFPQKHLNIIDPLNENNNLGRSINRGNFSRIRSAFKYGARKLGQILVLPKEKIADEICSFFENTLVRHGSFHLGEVQNSVVDYGERSSDNRLSSASSSAFPDLVFCSPNASCFEEVPSHFPSSEMLGQNGTVENGISRKEMVENVVRAVEFKCRLQIESIKKDCVINNAVCLISGKKVTNLGLPATSSSVDNVMDIKLTAVDGAREIGNTYENSRFLKSLLGLTGDYDIHLQSLEYVRSCHLYAVSAPVLPCQPKSPQSQIKNPSESVGHSMHLQQHSYSQGNVDGIFAPQVCHMNHSAPLSAHIGSEEKTTQRGTGTYIPNVRYHSKERFFTSRSQRKQSPRTHGQLYGHSRDNETNGKLRSHSEAKGTNGQLCRYAHDNKTSVQLLGHAENYRTNFQLHRHAQSMGSPTTLQMAGSTSKHINGFSEAEYPYLANEKPTSQQPRSPSPSVSGTADVNGASHSSKNTDSEYQCLELNERSMSERPSSYSTAPCTTVSSSSSPELMSPKRSGTKQAAEDQARY